MAVGVDDVGLKPNLRAFFAKIVLQFARAQAFRVL